MARKKGVPGSAYKGSEPYIFISYAHKNDSEVYKIIVRLQEEGYRVWYDEGIDPGIEWAENIAAHVDGCDYFIAFISPEYVASTNCQDELSFARDMDKKRLMVYLSETEMTKGMLMRLNRMQAIHKYRYDDEEDFYEKLFTADGINICLDEKAAEEEAPEPIVEEVPASIVEEIPEPVVEEAPALVVEEITEPVIEEIPEPVVEEAPAPVVEEIPEPVVEEAPAPVVEEVPEPVVEEIPEPVVEEVPAPVVEEAPAPVVEEIPEPVVEEVPAPVVEEAPEPVVEETPEPVAEEIPEPVVEEAPEPAAESAPAFAADSISEPEPLPAGEAVSEAGTKTKALPIIVIAAGAAVVIIVLIILIAAGVFVPKREVYFETYGFKKGMTVQEVISIAEKKGYTYTEEEYSETLTRVKLESSEFIYDGAQAKVSLYFSDESGLSEVEIFVRSPSYPKKRYYNWLVKKYGKGEKLRILDLTSWSIEGKQITYYNTPTRYEEATDKSLMLNFYFY